MILRSVARLLRRFGYDSLLCPSAEAFAKYRDFDGRFVSFSTSAGPLPRDDRIGGHQASGLHRRGDRSALQL